MMYKIMHNLVEIDINELFYFNDPAVTRGHNFKVVNPFSTGGRIYMSPSYPARRIYTSATGITMHVHGYSRIAVWAGLLLYRIVYITVAAVVRACRAGDVCCCWLSGL